MAHGSTPPLVETIRQIKQNFRGLIPDDIIDRISDDIDNVDDIPDGLGYDEPRDVLYVGVDPFSKSLIAATPAAVTSQALDAAISAWSKTWGQYRGLNGYFNYFDSTPQYDSFDEYVTAKLGEDPMMSLDEMWAEYEALSYVTERPIMEPTSTARETTRPGASTSAPACPTCATASAALCPTTSSRNSEPPRAAAA